MTQTYNDGTPVPEDGFFDGPEHRPPPDQLHAQPLNPYLGIENALVRIAKALENLGSFPASAPSAPPGASGPPGGGALPSGGPPAPQRSSEEKMSGKVFAVCKAHGWDVQDVGRRATGRELAKDSRQWSRDDLMAVLDKFKEWGA